MKALSWVLLMLSVFCFARPAGAPIKPPRTLIQLMHCLETDKAGVLRADLKKGEILTASFAYYAETDPYKEGFVLVTYESNTKGEVFDYVRGFEHGNLWFYLVNNAGFSIGPDHGLVVSDALGGVWTQGHLKQRAKRAMRNPRYSIPVESMASPFRNVGCHAYWDPE
jgi:hypothetical protein